MARVSKGPHRAFTENLKVARGFVKMRKYISDLLTGGEETLRGLLAFADQALKLLGLGRDFMVDVIEDKIRPEIETKVKELESGNQGDRAKAVEAVLKPQVEQFMSTYEEVKIAVERGLLQQALVVAVSALEVYLHDLTVDVVASNRFVERLFTKQLTERFDYRKLQRTGHDLGQAVGEAVAESYRFQDPRSVRRHLATLLGRAAPLGRPADVEQLRLMQQYRNLVAHRAGIVDADFRTKTGYNGKVGEPVMLSPKNLEIWLDFAEKIAGQVQTQAERLRVRSS